MAVVGRKRDGQGFDWESPAPFILFTNKLADRFAVGGSPQADDSVISGVCDEFAIMRRLFCELALRVRQDDVARRRYSFWFLRGPVRRRRRVRTNNHVERCNRK